MKEIVVVTLAFGLPTGKIDPAAPFMVNSQRAGMRYNRPYEDEPEVIAQFHPGEWQARFEAEWGDETANWKFGKRVDKQAVNAAENCALNSLIVAVGVYCYADPATRLPDAIAAFKLAFLTCVRDIPGDLWDKFEIAAALKKTFGEWNICLGNN